MSVVRTKQKQHYWHAEEELFRRGVLGAIVDLLPHVQIIVSSCIKFKRYSSNPVEHEEGAEHVGYIRQGPRRFL